MIESKPVGVLAALLATTAGCAIVYDTGIPPVLYAPVIIIGLLVAILYQP
ncbi:hypothetical protein [Mycolicibacterium fortuitum]|nr:hypothetical protein [Mycolicibacterium fortuitum]